MLKMNLRKNSNNSQPQQKTNHRLQQVAEDYQPGDCLKEGTQIFILCENKWSSSHQQRELNTVCVDVFHRNFSSAGGTELILLTTFGQAGPSHQLPDIMLLDVTFIAFALQMLHERHTTWLLVETYSYTLHLMVRPRHETDFYTYCIFCILQTMHRDLMKAKNVTDYGNKGLSLTHWTRPKLNSVTPQTIWQWTR